MPPVAPAILGALLTTVVGLASGGAPWVVDESGDGGSLPAPVRDALVVGLAAGLCALVVTAWATTPRPARRGRRRRRGDGLAVDEIAAGVRTGLRVLLAGLAGFVALIGAFAILLGRASSLDEPPPVSGVGAGTGAAPSSPATGPASVVSPTFHWFVAGLVASLAIMVPIGLLVRRGRREREPGPSASAPQDRVTRAVVDSIAELERDPDARRSIIRAYARMETAFGDTGIPRRPHEVPFEYVGRALGAVEVSPGAAERLAALFERARFSRHAVGADEKGEALVALREIQHELEPAS